MDKDYLQKMFIDEVKPALSRHDHTDEYNDGFEKGKDAEWDEFWEEFQNGGTRQRYEYAFYMFTPSLFKPKYKKFICRAQAQLFRYFGYYGVDAAHDFVEMGIELDFSNSASGDFSFIFATGGGIKRLGTIDLTKATTLTYAFAGPYAAHNDRLQQIDKLICAENNAWEKNSFANATALSHIGFEGVVARSLYLQECPLDVESMKAAILCLKNFAGTDKESVYTVKFSDSCWVALEADSAAPDGGTWKDYVDSLGWLT